MMHKTNSNRWMMTKAVVLPALMALAIVAFAKPKVEENGKRIRSDALRAIKASIGQAAVSCIP